MVSEQELYQELGKRPICTFHCHGFRSTIFKNYTVTMFLGPILSSTLEKCRLHGQCQVSPRGGLFLVGFVCYHRPGHAVHRRSAGIEARHSASHARQLLHKGTGRISLQVYFQVRRFSFIFEPLFEVKCCTKSLLWLELLHDFVGSIFAGLEAGNFTFVFLSRIIRIGMHMPCKSVIHQ